MKIIYLHQYFNTPSMSGGTRSYEMAKRLVEAGHEVHMITSYRGKKDSFNAGKWFHSIEDGILVHWLYNEYSNYMSYKRRILSFLIFAINSSIMANKMKGDVIFATSTPLTIAIPGLYAAKRNNIPLVFEVRDLWPEGPIRIGAIKNRFTIAFARWMEKKAYYGSDHVVALSPEMKKGIIERGYPKNKILVIPNSSDVRLFRISPERGKLFLRTHSYLAEGPLIVYVGTLGIINGVDYLVDIAKEMLQLNKNIRFLVVGDGKMRESIRKRSEEIGVLGKNYWMLPPVPKKDVPDILSASSLCVSFVIEKVSDKAQSANKVFDAFAAGKPVLINHRGWFADLIRKTGAGLIVPERNAFNAAWSIQEFLSDSEKVNKAIIASKKLADTQFNRDIHAKQLNEILISVVASRRQKEIKK